MRTVSNACEPCVVRLQRSLQAQPRSVTRPLMSQQLHSLRKPRAKLWLAVLLRALQRRLTLKMRKVGVQNHLGN